VGNVYIVTRIMFKLREVITEIPNLGVHSSYKKAMRHYKSVREGCQKSTKGLH
jgi:hypothetical protein